MKRKYSNNEMKDFLGFIKQQLQMNFRVYWNYLRYGTGRIIIYKYISCLRFCNKIEKLIDKNAPKFLKSRREGGENGEGIFSYKCYYCPVCETPLAYEIKNKRIKYCPVCGQRLK